jgi:hypothetical protein
VLRSPPDSWTFRSHNEGAGEAVASEFGHRRFAEMCSPISTMLSDWPAG